MRRRTYLSTFALATISLTGCVEEGENGGTGGDGSENGNGNTVVDETVFSDRTYPFEAEPGDEIEVEAHLQEGHVAIIVIQGPDSERVLDAETEHEDSWSAEAEQTGTHRAYVSAGDGEVDVTIRVS